MKTLKILLPLCFLTASVAFADSTQSDTSQYQNQVTYANGWSKIEPAGGGLYVYSNQIKHDERSTQRFMIGRPQRTDYELFSDQEQEALWNLRQEKLNQIALVEESNTRHFVRRSSFKSKEIYNWPRGVVNGNRTCVPHIEHSDDEDWKAHLICWDKESKDVK